MPQSMGHFYRLLLCRYNRITHNKFMVGLCSTSKGNFITTCCCCWMEGLEKSHFRVKSNATFASLHLRTKLVDVCSVYLYDYRHHQESSTNVVSTASCQLFIDESLFRQFFCSKTSSSKEEPMMYLNDDLHHHILLKNEQSYASLADRADFALMRFSSILFVPSFLSSQQSLFKCSTTQFQKIVFAFNV